MTYVIHVASPYPGAAPAPKEDKEVVEPAVDGTQAVLKACVTAKSVKRVVLTSSCVAVGCEYICSVTKAKMVMF